MKQNHNGDYLAATHFGRIFGHIAQQARVKGSLADAERVGVQDTLNDIVKMDTIRTVCYYYGLFLLITWILKLYRKTTGLFYATLPLLVLIACTESGDRAIQPWEENPRYWQFKGEPVLLIGGFDIASPQAWIAEDLEKFINDLDRMVAAEGNYLRCIMYIRDHWHPERPTPFKQLQDGRFDLNQWNEVYWIDFEFVLEESAKRDVIIQIELWDGQNFQRRWESEQSLERWRRNPYHPDNNVNYSVDETTLPADWQPSFTNDPHPAFHTVPELQHDETVLPYQERYVSKVLEYALEYDNVLYVPQNETWAPQEWSNYWAEFIREKAANRGRTVYVGDMRFIPTAAPVIHHDFDFAELSQSASGASRPEGSNVGQGHFDSIVEEWSKLNDAPVPSNSVKQYGAGDEGVERVWRTIFAGQASARFHRPEWGLGLNERAVANIRSIRMVTEAIDVFNVSPHQLTDHLLIGREEDEAYLMADPGRVYAVFFSNEGRETNLDISEINGGVEVRWIDPNKSEWSHEESHTNPGDVLSLVKPGEKQWVAVVTSVPQ